MGRRFLAGTIELLLAILGFALVLAWFWQISYATYRQFKEHQPVALPNSLFGKVGFILFLASWLLSWNTSLSLLRTAAKNESNAPPKLPPPKIG